MKFRSGLTLVILGVAICASASATPLPATGTFIYSNACASDGGDWSGYLVTLSRNPRRLTAIIEFNDEGPDSGHVQARNINFDPASGALRFTYASGLSGTKYTFTGTVSRERIVAVLDGRKQTLLPIKRAPPSLPDCH